MKDCVVMSGTLSVFRDCAVGLLLGLTLGIGASSIAHAQTLAIGKSLYATHCQSCHHAPPRYVDGAQRGANNANLIRATINRGLGGMDILSFLSDQDLKDVAAYIGNHQGVPAAASANTERVLNWAEWKFQDVLLPRTSSQAIGAFTARQYTGPGLFVGTDGSDMYLYNPATGLSNIGPLNTFLQQAQGDGF